MFEAKAAGFLYCTSPLHMGSGTELGPIDNPVQRERHTGHPSGAGSGLKGAFRHEASARWQDPDLVTVVFGPDTDSAHEHAGAVSFSDAQLVLFPVRSLRASYVYATCPTALARCRRLLSLAGVKEAQNWEIPEVSADGCVVLDREGLCQQAGKGGLVLETFRFALAGGSKEEEALQTIAKWLAENALPTGNGELGTACAYFREKIAKHTVLLSDERFGHFVRHAMVVEPHVRIADETGTADDGGLFYTECVPPESLFVFLTMASQERRPR
ncbi:MAG: type III-B CRISPR module RAMP protein Cmr4, partial [Planctomycetota bacterium]